MSAPVGDFFGVGLGRIVPFQSALFSSPEGRSFNASVPMPFRDGMRIVLTNESGANQPQVYYDVDYTLGDQHPADALYFHADFRRENPTKLQRDYEILPHVTGKGRYLGTNVGVIVDGQRYGQTWWGEGEVKIYLDGDQRAADAIGHRNRGLHRHGLRPGRVLAPVPGRDDRRPRQAALRVLSLFTAVLKFNQKPPPPPPEKRLLCRPNSNTTCAVGAACCSTTRARTAGG